MELHLSYLFFFKKKELNQCVKVYEYVICFLKYYVYTLGPPVVSFGNISIFGMELEASISHPLSTVVEYLFFYLSRVKRIRI